MNADSDKTKSNHPTAAEEQSAPPLRTVTPPGASFNIAASTETKILGVDLAEGEEVEWIWNMDQNGQKSVSGHRIIKSVEEDSIAPAT